MLQFVFLCYNLAYDGRLEVNCVAILLNCFMSNKYFILVLRVNGLNLSIRFV